MEVVMVSFMSKERKEERKKIMWRGLEGPPLRIQSPL